MGRYDSKSSGGIGSGFGGKAESKYSGSSSSKSSGSYGTSKGSSASSKGYTGGTTSGKGDRVGSGSYGGTSKSVSGSYGTSKGSSYSGPSKSTSSQSKGGGFSSSGMAAGRTAERSVASPTAGRVGSGPYGGGAGPGRGPSPGGPTSPGYGWGGNKGQVSTPTTSRIGSPTIGAGRGLSMGGPALGSTVPSTRSIPAPSMINPGRGVTPGGPMITGGQLAKTDRLSAPAMPGRSLTVGGQTIADINRQAAAMPTVDRFGPPTAPATRGLDVAGIPTIADVPMQQPAGMPDWNPVSLAGPLTPEGPLTPALPGTTVAKPTLMDAPNYRIDVATAPKVEVKYVNPAAGPQKSDIADRWAAAVAAELGTTEEARVRVISGHRPTPRGQVDVRLSKQQGRTVISSGRHVEDAIDAQVDVKTPSGWKTLDRTNPEDAKTLANITERAMRDFGVLSVGYGKRAGQYMGPRSTHVDIDPRANEWSAAKEDAARHAAARTAYKSSTVAPAQPVSSMLASANQQNPQMAALNRASGTPTAVAALSRPQAAQVAARPGAVAAPAAASTTAATAPAASTSAPAPRSAPTPTARPTAQAVDRVTTGSVPAGMKVQTPTAANPYQRSLTGQGAALGMDVLTAASGPVGLAANLATGLFLGTTVGGAVWDASHGRWGENQYSPGDTAENREGATGRGREYPTATRTTPEKVAEEVEAAAVSTTPADTFIAKYIDPKPAAEIPRTPIPDPVYDWTPKQHSPLGRFSWEV